MHYSKWKSLHQIEHLYRSLCAIWKELHPYRLSMPHTHCLSSHRSRHWFEFCHVRQLRAHGEATLITKSIFSKPISKPRIDIWYFPALGRFFLASLVAAGFRGIGKGSAQWPSPCSKAWEALNLSLKNAFISTKETSLHSLWRWIRMPKVASNKWLVHRFLGRLFWHPECWVSGHKQGVSLANACLSPCKVSNCLVRPSFLLAPNGC